MEYKSIKDLPLKIFFEIAETGNVQLLGKDKVETLVDRWEVIVYEYSEADDNKAMQNVINKNDELYNQAALYCEIKGMLLYLVGANKQEYIDRLKILGYKINTSTRKEKIQSIKENDSRANHISTRMQIISSEIETYSSGEKASFDSVMAWLSSNLGFEPREDITVLRYLSYKKQISERNKAKRPNNRRGVQLA